MTPGSDVLIRNLIPIVIIALVAVRLIMRSAKPRPLKIEWMWIRPVLFIVIGVALLAALPPPLTLVSAASIPAGLLLGCALGWQRGRLIRIEVHPETHDVMQRASPAAVIFLIALMALRYGARDLALQGVGSYHLSFNLIFDVLGLFAVGMMVTQSAEMWIRARRLLAQARATQVTQAAG